MPLIVIKPRVNKGSAGDGGPVGPIEYAYFLLGVPHFAPYLLPAKILISKVLVSSPNINQTATITIHQPIAGISELVPATDYITTQEESFAPNTYYREAGTVDSLDATDELPVVIVYQRINI